MCVCSLAAVFLVVKLCWCLVSAGRTARHESRHSETVSAEYGIAAANRARRIRRVRSGESAAEVAMAYQRPPLGDPPAVLNWRWRDPDNPRCKCKVANPHEMDRDTPEWEGAALTEDTTLVFNRCKFFHRRNGCRHGDACTHCHEHALTKRDVDHSQVVADPQTGRVRKMHRDERHAQRAARTAADRDRQFAWAQMILSAEQDAEAFVELGVPIEGVHVAVWTVHRLLEDARRVQERVARLLDVPVHFIGIWLGVDKLSTSPEHYPLGEAHGVHTLMKGLATRLPSLLARTTASHVWILEGDAYMSDAVAEEPGLKQWLLFVTKTRNFLQLGFFTNAVPPHDGQYHWEYRTHEDAEAQGLVGGKRADRYGAWFKTPDNWPWTFKADARRHLCPKFGCQWFSLAKDFAIRTWCPRLLWSPRPFGLDMFFHSDDCLSNEENAFLSWSLAGQFPGGSDSFGGLNLRAGPVEEPAHADDIEVRTFAEPEVRRRRRAFWQEHLSYNRQHEQWARNPSYRRWLSTGGDDDDANVLAEDLAASRIGAAPASSGGGSGVSAGSAAGSSERPRLPYRSEVPAAAQGREPQAPPESLTRPDRSALGPRPPLTPPPPWLLPPGQ